MKTDRRFPSLWIQRWKLRLVGVLLAALGIAQTSYAANFYQGVSPMNLPWTGGIVPYKFETNVTPAQQVVYLAGLREWELAGNIQFVPYTNQPRFVLLQLFIDGSGTGQYIDGPNPVMRLHGLSRGLMCHEGGHLLGLQHEHQRTDRNDYIIVNYSNIISGAEGEFAIDSNSVPFGPYELDSVMHYNQNNFSVAPGQDSLDPLPAYADYYHRLGNMALSIGDRQAAAYLYGSPAVPLTNVVTTTADGGSGSLRAAIYYANDHPDTVVSFNISTNDPGYSNGVYTIYLIGQMPPLVGTNTVLDGTTQPGFTNKPVVALDGSQVVWSAGDVSGLHVFGSNCVVRALALNNFSDSGLKLLNPQAVSNRIEGCYIGLQPDGTNAAPNAVAGVMVGFAAHDNIIGGLVSTQRNVVSGNSQYGIQINDTNTVRNRILGNYIGLDDSGTLAVGNGSSGVGIWLGARDTVIGGAGGGRNLISGNSEYGIYLGDTNTSGILIQGNYIGTDSNGTSAVANMLGGIGIFNGARQNTIGGTNAGDGNVISGNENAGIWLMGSAVVSNSILGNLIGVDATGMSSVPNTDVGIYLLSGVQGNTIGGPTPEARNILSGNGSAGVYLSDTGTSNNHVRGNYIGLSVDGSAAISNGWTGIYLLSGASGNVLGGTNSGSGNVMSGNYSQGIYIAGVGTSGNFVQGNFIGTGPQGTNAFSNGFTGVGVWGGASSNIIGGEVAGARNYISANAGYGIVLGDSGTSGNVVQGNFVGIDITGTNALGNTNAGCALWAGAAGNVIGGINPGAGNVIAFNGGEGVVVYDDFSTNNTIRGNSIFDNGGLGINLVGGLEDGFGVTTNDLEDVDDGPNRLQNFPVITTASVAASVTTIRGEFNGATNGNFWIDLYRGEAADASGHGEGQNYIASVSVGTDGAGAGNFSINVAGTYSGQYLTATATAMDTGDTSEFGPAILATNGPPPFIYLGPPQVVSNGLKISITLETNRSYRVQAATNLLTSPIVWTDLTNVLAIASPLEFIDHHVTNFPVRFYRAVTP